jgi:hypothetical protein
MREILKHRINKCNRQITIHSGELDTYLVRIGPNIQATIAFQRGPEKTVGVNGLTNETLLAIVADRLERFQAGPAPCEENAEALELIEQALGRLAARVQRCINRNPHWRSRGSVG